MLSPTTLSTGFAIVGVITNNIITNNGINQVVCDVVGDNTNNGTNGNGIHAASVANQHYLITR